MKTMRLLIVFLTYLFCTSAAWAQQDQKAPELFTYDEIVQLYQQDVTPAALRDKLKQLLSTPFVSNRAFRSGVRPLKPASPPARLSDPHDAKQPYRFAPHFGRTLKELNQSIPDRISDHSPITVDLPLGEPPILQDGEPFRPNSSKSR